MGARNLIGTVLSYRPASPNFLTLKEPKNRFQGTGGPVRQPYFSSYSVPSPHRLFKNSRARICRSFKETRYRFSAWRAGTKPYLSYWPARQHRLAKSIPRNRFLGSINVYKYGLRTVLELLGIDSLEPFPRLLKVKKIRALYIYLQLIDLQDVRYSHAAFCFKICGI
jgi:hypothetical protein